MDIAASASIFAPLPQASPAADFRVNGQKIPRQSPRASGRASIHAADKVSEPPPLADTDTPLAFSMEGSERQPPAALIDRYWSPGWNSVQSLNRFQEEVGGLLRGGAAGVRLITGVSNGQAYFETIPAPFMPRADAWRVLPIYHIFGSEELSARSPAVAARALQPYMALNPADAAKLGLAEGETAVLDHTLVLPVKLLLSLPVGTVGLPVEFSTSQEMYGESTVISQYIGEKSWMGVICL